MKTAFLDTGFVVALIRRGDQYYESATREYRALKQKNVQLLFSLGVGYELMSSSNYDSLVWKFRDEPFCQSLQNVERYLDYSSSDKESHFSAAVTRYFGSHKARTSLTDEVVCALLIEHAKLWDYFFTTDSVLQNKIQSSLKPLSNQKVILLRNGAA